MKEESIDDIFGRRVMLPDREADKRLARLIGIDEQIDTMVSCYTTLIVNESDKRI